MREVELGEVAEIFGGYAFRSKDFKETPGIPVIKISNIQNGKVSEITLKEFLPENYLVEYDNYQINRGDILVALSGATTGKTGIYKLERKSLLNQRVGLVRAKDGHADQKYLSYYVSKITDDILSKAQGVAQPNISTKELSKFEIPLPSLSEQKAIVAKLDRAQRLIDIDKKMLAKYDELIQSVFLEMFGDPVTNPKGWDKLPFKEIAEIDKESFDPTNFQGSVDYVGLNSIVKDSGKFIDVKTIIEGYVKSNKYKFSPKHILYGKLRPYLNKVAFPDFDGVCSTDILPIKQKEDISTKLFVGYLMKTDEFLAYADKNSSGANLPRISPKMIKKFECILPPYDLQLKFDDLVYMIQKNERSTNGSLKKSEKLFSSLVQEAFSNDL